MAKNVTYKDFITIKKFKSHITVIVEIPQWVRMKLDIQDKCIKNADRCFLYHFSDGSFVINFIFKGNGRAVEGRYGEIAALQEYLIMNMEIDKHERAKCEGTIETG